MRAPLVCDLSLGSAKPSPAEVTMERAIGCGYRPLFVYKVGPKWAHVIYVATLTTLRVRVSQLSSLVEERGAEIAMKPRMARVLLRRIREKIRLLLYAPAAVGDAMDVLEKIIEEAKEKSRGEGAADPEVSQARDARPDQVHPKEEA